MYTAKLEFSSTRGLYKPGDEIKIKNQAILDRWASMGFIEKEAEEVKDSEQAEDAEAKEISDSKPRISEISEI